MSKNTRYFRIIFAVMISIAMLLWVTPAIFAQDANPHTANLFTPSINRTLICLAIASACIGIVLCVVTETRSILREQKTDEHKPQ